MLTIPLVLESHFELAAEAEIPVRLPWLFAILYRAFGFIGFRVIFWGGGILFIGIAVYFAKQWRIASQEIA